MVGQIYHHLSDSCQILYRSTCQILYRSTCQILYRATWQILYKSTWQILCVDLSDPLQVDLSDPLQVDLSEENTITTVSIFIIPSIHLHDIIIPDKLTYRSDNTIQFFCQVTFDMSTSHGKIQTYPVFICFCLMFC